MLTTKQNFFPEIFEVAYADCEKRGSFFFRFFSSIEKQSRFIQSRFIQALPRFSLVFFFLSSLLAPCLNLHQLTRGLARSVQKLKKK